MTVSPMVGPRASGWPHELRVGWLCPGHVLLSSGCGSSQETETRDPWTSWLAHMHANTHVHTYKPTLMHGQFKTGGVYSYLSWRSETPEQKLQRQSVPRTLLSSCSGGHSAYGLRLHLAHPGLSMTWLCSPHVCCLCA